MTKVSEFLEKMYEEPSQELENEMLEEILEEMKKYVEPGIEEICDWESGSSPIVYVLRGEKTLEKTGKFQDKITIIYKKVTPLDIPIEV